MQDTRTDVPELFEALNAGVFQEKLGAALSDVSQGAVLHGGGKRRGKVVIELTIVPIDEDRQDQVIVAHKISTVTPTKRGKRSEEDLTSTPMFVGRGGRLHATKPPENSNGQLNMQGDIAQLHPKKPA